MLRLLVGKLPHLAGRSPRYTPRDTTLLPFLFRSPIAGDHTSTAPKPTVYTRGLSSIRDGSSSALSTLTSYGIPVEQATAMLTKLPQLRNSDPRILEPKLEFLLNAGLTSVEMTEVLTKNPSLLVTNLDRSIAPSVHFVKTILPSKDDLVHVLKLTNWFPAPKMEANIKVLKAHGVPDAMIPRLIRLQPRALARSEEEFTAAVERVKELGLAPTTGMFVTAVGVLSYMSRSSFQRKVDLYRELGWSEEAFYAMFKRMPECLGLSDENIRAKMGYFMEKLGWGPELLKMNPKVLGMNLDKKIIPRCAVLNLLMVKGLLRKNVVGPSWVATSERRFFARYVSKYQDQVPEVVKAREGKIAFQGWERFKDDEKSSNSKKS